MRRKMGISKKENRRDGLILLVALTKPFGSKHGSKKKKGACVYFQSFFPVRR